MKKVLQVAAVLIFVSLISTLKVSAQCSMCKATIKENVEKGQGVGNGINKGILYLMAIPYLAGGTIAFFWYRSSRRNKDTGVKLT